MTDRKRKIDEILVSSIMLVIGGIVLWANLHNPTPNELREEGKAQLRKEILQAAESCKYDYQVNASPTEGELYFHCCKDKVMYIDEFYGTVVVCNEQNGTGAAF